MPIFQHKDNWYAVTAGVVKRRLIVIATALLIVLAAAHTLLWRWAENRLVDSFAAWRADSQSAGWIVTSDPPVRAGWPLAARLRLSHPGIRDAGHSIPGGLRWNADQLVIEYSLWHPRLFSIAVTGSQTLQLAKLPPLHYRAGICRLSRPVQSDAAVLDVLAKDMRFGLPAPQSGVVPAADLTLHLDWGTPAALALRVEAISLPPGLDHPFGPHVSSVSLDAALTGVRQGSPFLQSGSLAAWRDHGGALSIPHFAFGWGPLGVSGKATMMVDAGLQPAGSGRLQIIGAGDSLGALTADGWLSRPGHCCPALAYTRWGFAAGGSAGLPR
jgi:hypothetical protein